MSAEGMAAGAAGGLRIGDSDRDQISTVLGWHAAEGRLTMDELDQRLGILNAAQTRAQAAAVLADLPPLTATGTSQHIHRGHDHSHDIPVLPDWLTVAGPPKRQASAQRPAPDVMRPKPPTPVRDDQAAARKSAKLRRDENAIGHTFQATRRAINAKLVAAAGEGNSTAVTDLTDRLRDAQDLAAAAREAVSAGDRAEVQRLLARLRTLG